MSASSKKKLRKENAAAQMTEKQQKELSEAKKLKRMTVTFVALMLVVAVSAGAILVVRGVNNSGVLEKNTIAAVIDGQELNSVQMNYYLNDYIKGMYSQWQNSYGSSTALYLGLMGLDVNKPLDEQVYDTESGLTWGEHFLNEALKKAKSDYALYAKATAEGFKLSEEEQKNLDSSSSMLDLYAMLYGYKNADKYLQALYGYGSTLETYNEYTKISTIASAYANKHNESLDYDMNAIREYEKDKKLDYTSFSYAIYALNQSSFLEGGTKDDKGNTTYSDAEKAAALKKAEEIANNLAKATDLADLDKAIAALEINKDKKDAASTPYTDVLYTSIGNEDVQKWLSDEKRVENEMTVIPIVNVSTDENGKETKTTTGYYVLVFQGRNENLRPLANVRHLLVKFKGGKTDANGNMTYTDAEKATAKADAQRLYDIWKNGTATEESFIAMVKEYSDDGSKDEGGLFEDIHSGSGFVESFLNWSIDPDRKAGDHALIVSEYGYHIMFYSSDDELTYRDYMIKEDMREADMEKWYDAIVDASTAKLEKTNRLNTDVILASLG